MKFGIFGSAALGLALANAAYGQQPAVRTTTPVAAPTLGRQTAFPTRAVSTQLPAAAGAPAQASPTQAAAMPAVSGGYPTAGLPTGDCGTEACPPAAACAACDCLCGPPGKTWVSAEWLYWTGRGQRTPAFVSTSPAGTSREQAGVLGAPGTQTLFGGNRINDDFRSGLLLRAGTWLDECQRFGVEANFFFLGQSQDNYSIGSDGSQILARPFTDALARTATSQLVSFGSPDSQLVSFPGVLAGSVGVRSNSDLIGGGLNFLTNLCCDPCGRLDFVYGFTYLNLRDEITVNENLTALAGANVPAGTRFLIQDRVRTSNNFYGANVGLDYERRFSHFYLGVRPAIAFGVTNTSVTIDGSTRIIDPQGNGINYAGGLLTQTSNIGTYSSNQFSVVPSVAVRAGVQVTEHLRAFVSYNFLYWNNVGRAGDQFDTRVNTNQIAPATGAGGPPLPGFHLQRDSYWVQGVGVGAELRF